MGWGTFNFLILDLNLISARILEHYLTSLNVISSLAKKRFVIFSLYVMRIIIRTIIKLPEQA